jgi:DNA-binding NarL/FixJ family response regulator
MVSSMMSSRFGEGFRRPSDREDIGYRDRGQLGLSNIMLRMIEGERYRLTPGPETLLTRRERAVLHHAAKGLSNRDVAVRLHVEEQTVKNNLRSVYKKLGIYNHCQAALYY